LHQEQFVKALAVQQIEKSFYSRRASKTAKPALRGVTFEVNRGECVAILGQNGSGKSTLVRVLSTLVEPDHGTASVFGMDVVEQASAVRRVVNRVSVEASFFKRMSAIENLSYAARFYGLTPSRTKVMIPEILDRVGFAQDRSREPMQNLSRGMQQKIALARALLTSPVVLLLDEPTTGLDPRSKREVQALIEDMREQHDTTVLLCTHDLDEAVALADRVGILHAGEMLAFDELGGLLSQYEAADLEETFFTATGIALAEDTEAQNA
jgi:ABC-2 type transport system ATP-binding protein